MSSIGAFFQKEINGVTFPRPLLEGEIESLAIDREDRSVQLAVRFPGFVEYGELQRFGGQVAGLSLIHI